MISDTSTSMDKIMLELGLPPDSKCYETSPLNKESIKSTYWKNLSQPIMVKNRNKFIKSAIYTEIAQKSGFKYSGYIAKK